MQEKPKIAVALSGGLDSSLAAALLKEAGQNIFGITMQIQKDSSVVAEAQKAASELGIPLVVAEAETEFEQKVIQYFVNSYLEGQTPNPCFFCNKEMKFSWLWRQAQKWGAEYLATGHYARIGRKGEKYQLLKGLDAKKDQSYVLADLEQEQLARTIFPLGEYSKEQVRQLAGERGLSTVHKKESQDICFIPDGDYNSFLQKRLGKQIQPGNFLNKAGEVIGRHGGYPFYTVGQRRGLGSGFGERMYVLEVRAASGEIVLGQNEDLLSGELWTEKNNFSALGGLTAPLAVEAKIRYNSPPAPKNGLVRTVFQSPQRAITPGQAVVFYQGEVVLGCGIILPTAF
ncbi:MAG: tRNA 2-thiouridine(34) synthase MnmA [Clostridia bacterium]|nr:tRNA 2-thiouridine(34) synthase MnmA [Clostridia bacterium]